MLKKQPVKVDYFEMLYLFQNNGFRKFIFSKPFILTGLSRFMMK